MGHARIYEYDLNGSLVGETDRNGNTITYQRDGLGRILRQAVVTPTGEGNCDLSFAYTRTGMPQLSSGGGISASFVYDDLGRKIQETDASGISKSYSYDAAHNRTAFLLSKDNQVVMNQGYQYDKMNRLQQVSDQGAVAVAYAYDPNGNRLSQTNANTTSTEYAYNLANMLTQLTNRQGTTVLSSFAYTYQLDGNQKTKTDHTGRVVAYDYDDLGRLTSEDPSDDRKISYTYDDGNNRLTKTREDLDVTAYAYDRNNRLLTETVSGSDATSITSLTYDNNGNTISSVTEVHKAPASGQMPGLKLSIVGEGAGDGFGQLTIHEYNGMNQLMNTTTADQTMTYSYQADGLRATKTVNGVPVRHIWDGDQIVLELSSAGAITAKYVRGINLISSEGGAGENKRIFLFNGHGDTVQLTDTSGNVVKSYDYDAFGNEKNPDAADTNVFRYCGEYYDRETGTYYLRARNYDPATSRMLSEDSNWGDIRDPLSLNLYTYCYNNPIRYTDPSGNVPVETVIDIASIGWSAADFISNPSWANAGFLAWDVAAALLPYVPGSYVAKGAKLIGKADDVADVARALSKADNIADAASAFQKNKGSIIMGYKELKNTVKSLKISGLEVHHLFEKRFADKLGLKADDILSVAMDKDTHQKVTNLFREKIQYNSVFDFLHPERLTTSRATTQQIWDATREVYTEMGMTKYLDSLKKSLIDNGKNLNWGEW